MEAQAMRYAIYDDYNDQHEESDDFNDAVERADEMSARLMQTYIYVYDTFANEVVYTVLSGN